MCTVSVGVTLFFQFAGDIYYGRLIRVRRELKLASVSRPDETAKQDPILRFLATIGPWLPELEMALRNEMVRLGPEQPVSPDLVYLGVDEVSIGIEALDLETSFADIPRESRDYRALNLMSVGWPYNREVHALAIDKLFEAGAKAVMVDFLFPKPAAGDRALQAALERYPNKVVIGCNYVPRVEDEDGAKGGGDAMQIPPSTVLPLEKASSFIGLVTFFPDNRDGRIRGARFHIDQRELGGFPPSSDPTDQFTALSARAAEKIGLGANVPPGTKETYFRFAGPAGTFAPQPFFWLFVPRFWERNFGNGAAFKDKVVMIGPYGNWSQDIQPTTKGPMPGPEVHLHALNALMSKAFLRETTRSLAVLVTCLGGLGVFILSIASSRALLRFFLEVLIAAALLGIAFVAYAQFDTYLLIASPILALMGSGTGVLVYDYTSVRVERARTRRTLERYMSANVVGAIMDDPVFFETMKRGKRMPVSILFSDIRGFTAMTESAIDEGAQGALVGQLNEYLGEMVACVFRYNGTVDKFVGDAVMAVWGNTPTTKGPKEDACDAVRCALAMLEALREMNARWLAQGKKEFHIGIGVNHGDVIVGEMGAPPREGSAGKMEITVIGDAVNTASRFEGLTKLYRVEFVIGEKIAELVRDRFVLQHADFNLPQGKKTPVEIFTVLGEDKGELRAQLQAGGIEDYEEGLRLYRARNAAGALAAFQRALGRRPGDALIERYCKMAEARLAEGAETDWSEVTVMTRK